MIRRNQTAEHFKRKPISWWKRETVPKSYEFVLTFLQNEAATNVLDIGSGRGAFAFRIRDMGMHVVAVEINPMFIEHCKAKDDCRDIDFVQGNVEVLPLRDEQFDTVICIEVLMHVPNPHVLLSEISRVLKWDGYAVVSYLQKYSRDYFKKMAMLLSGFYSMKYGKHAFDYRYDTFRDVTRYLQDTNLVINEIHNEESGGPCLILEKTQAQRNSF